MVDRDFWLQPFIIKYVFGLPYQSEKVWFFPKQDSFCSLVIKMRITIVP